MFFPFDQVSYVGKKFPELRNSLGIICGRVRGSKSSFTVDFGKDAYVMHESLLEKFKPNTKEDVSKAEAEIYKRRSRKNEDE